MVAKKRKMGDVIKNTVEGMSEEKKATLTDAFKVIITKGHKSRTIMLSWLLIFFGIGQEVLLQFNESIPPEIYGGLTSLSGMAVMGLRYLTTTSLEES